jgi:hypothetical protein
VSMCRSLNLGNAMLSEVTESWFRTTVRYGH